MVPIIDKNGESAQAGVYDIVQIAHDPFCGPEIVTVIPTTESQREIWAACYDGSEQAKQCFHETYSIELHGRLNIKYLEKAFQSLVEKHESLRSTISADGMSMFVHSGVFLQLEVAEVNPNRESRASNNIFLNLPTEYFRDSLNDSLNLNNYELFDLQNGPLLRVKVIVFSELRYKLIMTFHQIIFDGWSMDVILSDLARYYNHLDIGISYFQNNGQSFSNFAINESKKTAEVTFLGKLSYWTSQFEKNIPISNLPTNYIRPHKREFDSSRAEIFLEKTLVDSIREFAMSRGVSFMTIFLSSFEILLSRLSNELEIVIGVYVPGQLYTGNSRLVGHCLNLLPFRSTLQYQVSFDEYLVTRNFYMLQALENQEVAFGKILRELRMPTDPSRSPLVQVGINFDHEIIEEEYFANLQLILEKEPKQFQNFELFLNVGWDHGDIRLGILYNSTLFSKQTIESWLNFFVNILDQVLTNPKIRIGDIHKDFSTSNRQPSDIRIQNKVSKSNCILELFGTMVQQIPNNVAVIFKDSSLSYAEIDNRANQISWMLRQSGVIKGDTVGLLVERSPEMVCAILGILKAGAAYIPLDTIYPDDRLNYMLTNANCKFLLTNNKFKNRLQSHITKEIYLDKAFAPGVVKSVQFISKTICDFNDLAYVIYTSGSTGNPKGVMVSHGNLLNFIVSMKDKPGISTGDTVLALTTISFDISVLEIFLPLCYGAKMVIVDSEATRNGPEIIELINRFQINFIQGTPVMLRMLLANGWSNLKNIKILCGGEAFPIDLAMELSNLSKEVWNMYGPTETTVWSTLKKITPDLESITVGHAIANTDIQLVDEDLNLVKFGEVGEICIGGAGVSKGYLNSITLTAERFIKISGRFGNTYYRTGDIGKFDNNGELVCLGRNDSQVKIRGYRIELGEIENVFGQLVGIKQVVVVAQQRDISDVRLIAYVIPEQEHIVDENIRVWKKLASAKLPAYMIPEVTMISAFPVTLNGKIDRNALPFVRPQPSKPAPDFIPVLLDEELMLKTLWEKSLNIANIGIHEDFFEIGGHSLTAVTIIAALNKQKDIKLSLSAIFEHSTIYALAKVLRGIANPLSKWKALVPIKTTGSKPPLYMIHGGDGYVIKLKHLAVNMSEDQPVYGLQAVGLNSEDEPLSTIEEIASVYISEMIAHNPTGPYALIGYSFGGTLAFEMAKQLTQMGKPVNMVGMLDAFALQSDYFQPTYRKIFNKISFNTINALYKIYFALKEPIYYADFLGKYRLRRFNLKMRWLISRANNIPDQEENEFSEILAKIDNANMHAFNNYTLRPYSGVIDLFRCQKRLYYQRDFKYFGWRKYAAGGVAVHDIPGDHFNLFDPNYAPMLSKIIQEVLDSRSQTLKTRKAPFAPKFVSRAQ